jgi:Ig-like domain CHU_C associated
MPQRRFRRLTSLAVCSLLAAVAAFSTLATAQADELTPVPFRLRLLNGKIEVVPVVHGPAAADESLLAMPDQTQPNCFDHSIACGDTVNGIIDPTGCQFENAPNYYTEYTFVGAQGDQGTATVTANFTPQVLLYDSAGATIAFDMAPGMTSSTISWTLPASGRYYLVVTSAEAISSGSYQLKLTCQTSNCQVPIVLFQPADVTVNGGQSALLAAAAGGKTPIRFEWYRLIPGIADEKVGTDSTSYQTPALTFTTQYYVKMINSCGTTRSRTATVTIRGGTAPAKKRAARH